MKKSTENQEHKDVRNPLHSLREDLKRFHSMDILTADIKTGLEIAIEQTERYISEQNE